MTNEKSIIPQINTSLYPNRWIAVVRERVVGVGLTQAQAHRAAMHTRGKDKPQLFFVDKEGQIIAAEAAGRTAGIELEHWLKQHPLLKRVSEILHTHQIEAYLVGGAVRDLLLGRESIIDLDFAVPKDGLAVARLVANTLKGAFYPLDEARGTGRVIYGPQADYSLVKTHLDFATFRGADLLADLQDRDFTINAMALRVGDSLQLIDPLQGHLDLEQKSIRAASKHSFKHDPVRILRAIRQAADFDFIIEAETEALLQQAVTSLPEVSPERQRDELVKLLNTPRPEQAVQQLQQTGVLAHLLPEVEALVAVQQSAPHHLPVFEHTLAALHHWAAFVQADFAPLPETHRAQIKTYLQQAIAGELTFQALLPLAILLHDTGKPLTRTVEPKQGDDTKIRFFGHEAESAKVVRQVMNRFRFSSQAISFVERVAAHHMRPLSLAATGKVSRRAGYRFFRDTRAKTVEAGVATALHALLDHRATYPANKGERELAVLEQVVDRLFAIYFEEREKVVDPPPLLTGQDLIKVLDLSEGKLIGLLLKRLKEAQAVGEIHDQETALDFVRADPDYIDYDKSRR